MTCTLIILAHPDRRSFNGQWAEATEKFCRERGDTILWSDLHAMQFDPVEKPDHYADFSVDSVFDVLKTQEKAAKQGTLPEEVHLEIEKVRKADRLVFHFPVWWFSPPAILKGWCDRVLANGALHNAHDRFDRGMCRGKRAFFCVTSGSTAYESSHDGKEGDITMLLWPFAYTLRYLGFTILQPKIVHGVHGYHKGDAESQLQSRLRATLDEHAQTIAGFDSREVWKFNADTDFDENGTLLPDAPSHSHFIRHLP